MGIDLQDSTPLYVQIIKDIKQKIDSGKLKTGEKLKSHKEMALDYDVSVITIKGAMSHLIDEGILFSRVGKGTFVAHSGVKKDITKHNSIALLLQDLDNPFFSMIAHKVEQTAYEQKYNLLLSNSYSKIQKEEGQINHFRNLGVKGMILTALRKEPHAPEIIRSLHTQGYPYVMVSYVADKDIYYVGTNHKKGAYLATEHLIKQGHKKIGYINSRAENALGNIRMAGYKEALDDFGIEFNASHQLQLQSKLSSSFKSGYEIGDHFHELRNKPTAYFSYNDFSAMGFIKRIQELGYKIPEDVAIVGFDDIEQSAYANIPLTTIQQQVEKIGTEAINKLINRIEGKKTEVQTIFEPKLIIRDSCGATRDLKPTISDVQSS